VQMRELTKGIFSSNPLFVIVLGVCPSLATSGEMKTAFAMSIAAAFVLLGSNVFIALIRNVVPGGVRIPCYIIVICTFVTIADLTLKATAPAISDTIGIFIPLIVVNCIMAGRAEAYALKNTVFNSLLDAIGMGIGYMLALLLLSFIRELAGHGTLFGFPQGGIPYYKPMSVMSIAPGAFLLLGLLLGFFAWLRGLRKAKVT